MRLRLFRIAFTATAAIGLTYAQPAETKTAEQVYKNITQLKGTPADQLGPAMQFIASSLGVDCAFCHVPGKFEADDKGAKKTARNMIAMTAAINKDAFGGRLQVTCFSCHRGAARPVAVPPVLETDGAPPKPPAPAPATSGAAAPTADEILAKYVSAVGGADAMHKVTSRVMKGSISAGGSDTPIDLFTKAPNKRVSISHMGNSDSYTAFDGAVGWMGNAGRPAREMSAPEAAAAGLDAEFYLALANQGTLSAVTPRPPRNRRRRGVRSVEWHGYRPPRRSPVLRKESGLLVRQVRFADTPVGRNPTQIDYADYRESDGVKVPFRWTLSRPNGRFTIQLSEVKAQRPHRRREIRQACRRREIAAAISPRRPRPSCAPCHDEISEPACPCRIAWTPTAPSFARPPVAR